MPKKSPGSRNEAGRSQRAATPAKRQAAPKRSIEKRKPPREWRSPREGSESGRKTPRVAQQVAASTPAPPAGSQPPAAAASEAPPVEAPHHAEAETRAVPPAPAHEASSQELEQRYGVDRLVLLVRDPYWIYAWWELKDSSLDAARGRVGESGQIVLRVYDISLVDWDGTNHHESFDIDVSDTAGNWYVELDNPGASFCAELGLRTGDGRFVSMIRSNVITLPRDSMSPIVDENWMVLEEDYRKLFELSGGGSIGLGSGEILRMLEERLRQELSSGVVSSFGVSSAAAIRKRTRS